MRNGTCARNVHLLWKIMPLLALAPLAAAGPPLDDSTGGSAIGGCGIVGVDDETAMSLDELLTRIENEDLHLTVVEHPELGLTIIGFGQGGVGEPKNTGARGFEYCQLGTGYDGDWYITGEKYCYGPGESVFFGAHYEMVYEHHWCGDGWYRPDGSQYFENQQHSEIPDPGDYGYDWWDWYNVVFWYDPMPGSMQQEEGSWTAKWWDDGSNVANKSYTVMYDLVDDTTCKDMTGDDQPLQRTSSFLVTDQYIYSWVQCDDFGMNQSDDFRWMWYGPEGFYTEIIHDADNPGGGSCWGWTRAWGRICVDGCYPAEHPGNWHVDVYIKDYSGSWDHKLTHNFTIDCVTSGPSITQQPSPSSATICDGQSQQWCVSGNGTGSLSYQWQRNTGSGWQNISGANSSCHNATIAGSYRCVVSDACGSTNSSTAFLTVRSGPSFTQQPDPPLAVVCTGNSQTWCIQASGSTPLSYQWQRNTGSGWQNISGATSTCVEADVDGSYRCQVTNDCGTVHSNAVTLVVAYPPDITTQPQPSTVTICDTEQHEWCVTATGAEPLEYQWERNTGSGWTLIPDATSACYSASQAASYRCGVSNDCGGPNYSDTVELAVEFAPLIGEIADHETLPGTAYSRQPQLLQGAMPVEWSLIAGPVGMTVDPATGEVEWPDPAPADSVHQVTIEAGNICGTHQQTWQLTVQPLPTWTIGGQVFTDQANPLFSGMAGVTVTVDGDGGLFTVETVSSPVPGLWEIPDVPQGQYDVFVDEPGYCFWHFVDGAPIDRPPLIIVVNEANQADNQSILFWAVEHIAPDFDCDDDVDFADFDVMVRCVAGPDVTTPPPGATADEFEMADLDNDGDVDAQDCLLFQQAYTGS